MNVNLPPADYRAIRTRYLGATNYRSSRIVADAGDRASRVTLEYDPALSTTDNHARAAVAVTEKMGWTGGRFTSLAGGEYGDSYVWVFIPRSRFVCCDFCHTRSERDPGPCPDCGGELAACHHTRADSHSDA